MKLLNSLFFILFVLSCSNQNEKEFINYSKNGIEVKINCPAGDICDQFFQSYLPSFFNIAETGNQEHVYFIIPGERSDKGNKEMINPIGIFSFQKDTVLHQYLLSTYVDSTMNSIHSKNYLDFCINHFDLKNMVEDWFKLNCKNENCYDYKWENELKAKNLVNEIIK